MPSAMYRLCASPILLVLVAMGTASAQDAPTPATPPTQEELAMQLANPIANLVSIPLQFNWEEGVGPDEDLRFIANFQPVVPFSLTKNWNLVGRLIVPYVSQPSLAPGAMPTAGTSDIVLSAFLSPVHVKHVIWGVGPVFAMPTTTDPLLGSGKWSMGPTAVVLKQLGPWTVGGLVNHLWSFAGTGDVPRADVNATLLQPFASYTTKTAVTVGVSIESTANWEAEETWTTPIFFNLAKVTKLGPFPFSIAGAVGVFAARPEGAAGWKLRMTGTLILPRGR